jgi:phosphocarrier protein HPr
LIEERVRVGSRLGLHARVAVVLVSCAVRFRARITLLRPATGQRADGRSILDLLLLAAVHGEELILRAEGADAGALVAALREIIEAP